MREPHDGSPTQAGLGSRINSAILRSLPAAKYTRGSSRGPAAVLGQGAQAGGGAGTPTGGGGGGYTQDSVGLPVLTVHGMLGQGQGLQWAEWEGWQDHEQKSQMHSCFLETLSDSAKGEGLWVRAREELSGSSINYDSLGSQSAFSDLVQFWSSVLICWVCKIGYDNAHCTAII